jgi:hypothetical protein
MRGHLRAADRSRTVSRITASPPSCTSVASARSGGDDERTRSQLTIPSSAAARAATTTRERFMAVP